MLPVLGHGTGPKDKRNDRAKTTENGEKREEVQISPPARNLPFH